MLAIGAGLLDPASFNADAVGQYQQLCARVSDHIAHSHLPVARAYCLRRPSPRAPMLLALLAHVNDPLGHGPVDSDGASKVVVGLRLALCCDLGPYDLASVAQYAAIF